MNQILGHSNGPIVTDGFRVLRNPHAFCWEHPGREFLLLENHDPTFKPILFLIDKLLEVDRRAKDFKELRKLRKDEGEEVLERKKILPYYELPKARQAGHK